MVQKDWMLGPSLQKPWGTWHRYMLQLSPAYSELASQALVILRVFQKNSSSAHHPRGLEQTGRGLKDQIEHPIDGKHVDICLCM